MIVMHPGDTDPAGGTRFRDSSQLRRVPELGCQGEETERERFGAIELTTGGEEI